MAIFLHFSPTSRHLYSLQVENCDSNSRLVVDEDDNGKLRLERVKTTKIVLSNGLKNLINIELAFRVSSDRGLQPRIKQGRHDVSCIWRSGSRFCLEVFFTLTYCNLQWSDLINYLVISALLHLSYLHIGSRWSRHCFISHTFTSAHSDLGIMSHTFTSAHGDLSTVSFLIPPYQSKVILALHILSYLHIGSWWSRHRHM